MHITRAEGAFFEGVLGSPIRGTDASSSAGFQRRCSASSAADARARRARRRRRSSPRAEECCARGRSTLGRCRRATKFFSRGRALAPTRWSRGTHSRPVARALDAETRAFAVSAMFLPPRTRTSSARTRRMRFTSGCVPHPPPEMQPHASSRHDASRLSSPPFPSPLPRCSATPCWTPRVAFSTRAASFVTSRSSASSRSCATPRSPPGRWHADPRRGVPRRLSQTSPPRRIVPRTAFRRWSLASLQALAPSALRRARTRAQTACRAARTLEANRVAPSESRCARLYCRPGVDVARSGGKPPPSPGRRRTACSRSCRR